VGDRLADEQGDDHRCGYQRAHQPHRPDLARWAQVTGEDSGQDDPVMRERLRLLNGTLRAGRCQDHRIVTAEVPRPRASVPS
jgi:hypothetical protein